MRAVPDEVAERRALDCPGSKLLGPEEARGSRVLVEACRARQQAPLARRFEQQYGRLGPFTPEEVGALVSNAFIGAESLVLTGLEKKDVPIRESLRRIGALIRNLDRRNP